jgi:cell division protein FtsB
MRPGTPATRRSRGVADREPRPRAPEVRPIVTVSSPIRRHLTHAVRGDRPLVVALVGAIVGGLLLVSGPAESYLDGRARVDQLAVKVDALDAENERLEQRVRDLQDPTTLELLARERHGFIRPGEVPYTLVPPEVERPRITAPRDPGETAAEPWFSRFWRLLQRWSS